jgi:putative tricarboxylic transport membrane protein
MTALPAVRRALRLLCAAALAAPALAPAAEWRPQKNVEILVGVAAGGALDITAREIQKIWQDQKLVEVTTSVVNRPGGAGAVAWAAMAARPGDAQLLSFASPTLLSNHITGVSPLSHNDFTPIAMLASDYIAFVVLESSPIKTGKDLIEAMKKAPGALRVGNAANAGNSNHVALARVAKSAGVDPKAIKVAIFNSGGQSMTNLLGGHVDLVVTAVYNAANQRKNGNVRILAISAPKRMPGALADVPVWKEFGADVVEAFWRGVIAPARLTAAQVAYWDGVFGKTAASREWKDIVQKNLWDDIYMNSAAMKAFLDKDYKELRQDLSDLGLVK